MRIGRVWNIEVRQRAIAAENSAIGTVMDPLPFGQARTPMDLLISPDCPTIERSGTIGIVRRGWG